MGGDRPTTFCKRVVPIALLSIAACTGQQADSVVPVADAISLPAGQLEIAAAQLPYLEIREVMSGYDEQIIGVPAKVSFQQDRIAAVTASVGGRVHQVHVRIGDKVARGASLATLTSPEAAKIRAERETAHIGLKLAQTEQQRQRTMADKGVGVEMDLIAAQARLNEAEHAAESADRASAFLGEGRADQVVLRAPRAGVVLDLKIVPGATADPGRDDPLFVIGEPDAVWVVADVFESELGRVAEGAAARVSIPAQTRHIEGRVERVSASLNNETGRAHVYVSVGRADPGLRAGMLATVDISVVKAQGISVPMNAVLIKDGLRTVVFVHKDGRIFEMRTVTLGQPRGGVVPILTGLTPGEKVVVKGGLLLDGSAGLLL
jgi:cobalt-zinc-cadmium efflux system membrane fusion protein